MLKYRVCVLCILFLFIPFTLTAHSQSNSEAQSVAQQFLSTLDNSDYESSWHGSSEILKRLKPLDVYIREQDNNQYLFGKALDRYDLTIKERQAMPELPDGDYVLLVYRTKFERKAEAWELVTVLKEFDEQWRVVDYEVR